MEGVKTEIPEERIVDAYRLLKEYVKTHDKGLLLVIKELDWLVADVYADMLDGIEVTVSRPGLTLVDLETGVAHRCDDKVVLKTRSGNIVLKCKERGRVITVNLGPKLDASGLGLLAFLAEQGADVLGRLLSEMERKCKEKASFYSDLTGSPVDEKLCTVKKPVTGAQDLNRFLEQYEQLAALAKGYWALKKRIIDKMGSPMPDVMIRMIRSELLPFDGYTDECIAQPGERTAWLDISKPTKLRVTVDVRDDDFCVDVKGAPRYQTACGSLAAVAFTSLCMPDLMRRVLENVKSKLREYREVSEDIAKVAAFMKLMRG